MYYKSDFNCMVTIRILSCMCAGMRDLRRVGISLCIGIHFCVPVLMLIFFLFDYTVCVVFILFVAIFTSYQILTSPYNEHWVLGIECIFFVALNKKGGEEVVWEIGKGAIWNSNLILVKFPSF